MSDRVWPVRLTVVPYVLLAVLAAITVLIKRSEPGSLMVDLVLCALISLWTLGMFTLRPAWRARHGTMVIFIAGYLLLLMVLVIRDPWFGFLTPAGYYYAFGLLPWPSRLAGVAAVAIVAGTAQAHGVLKDELWGVLAFVSVLAVNVVAMCVGAWIVRSREVMMAENAALHRQAGINEERQRMAREIHDTLAQGLTGIVTQLQAAEHAQDWRRHVTAAVDLARESLTEARRSVHALRPESLQQATLAEALDDVVRRWSALQGIAVQLTTTGTARELSPDAEFVLLRTTQEALANVAKYARATRVGVTLSYLEKEVAVDIRDDGVGFDVSRRTTGFGLVAMRERVEALGGTLVIESEPGSGTAISATLP